MKMEHSRLNKNTAHILLFLFVIIFACCNKDDMHNKGFTLKEIKINNARIDSVTKDFIDRQLSYKYDSADNALLLDILIYPNFQSTNTSCLHAANKKVISYDNRTLFIAFSKQNKHRISGHHIFRPLYKSIIGYYTYKNTNIIILTNINDKQVFKFLLNNTFSYTKRRKMFEYIKYPKEQSDIIIYDPLFLCYKMVDGYITDSILTTNMEYSWNINPVYNDTCTTNHNKK